MTDNEKKQNALREQAELKNEPSMADKAINAILFLLDRAAKTDDGPHATIAAEHAHNIRKGLPPGPEKVTAEERAVKQQDELADHKRILHDQLAADEAAEREAKTGAPTWRSMVPGLSTPDHAPFPAPGVPPAPKSVEPPKK